MIKFILCAFHLNLKKPQQTFTGSSLCVDSSSLSHPYGNRCCSLNTAFFPHFQLWLIPFSLGQAQLHPLRKNRNARTSSVTYSLLLPFNEVIAVLPPHPYLHRPHSSLHCAIFRLVVFLPLSCFSSLCTEHSRCSKLSPVFYF